MAERFEHSWAVDGIQEGVVRIEEDGAQTRNIPRYLLPAEVAEGQLLRVTSSSASGPESVVVTIAIDHAATSAALRKSSATMEQTMAESKKRDRGGDVVL